MLDSLVVDLEYLGRESWMPLFVVLRDGHRARRRADAAASTQAHPRRRCRARHVPNEIFQVADDAAHAVGQEDGAAGQEAAARHPLEGPGACRHDGQPDEPRLVRAVRAGARAARLKSGAVHQRRRRVGDSWSGRRRRATAARDAVWVSSPVTADCSAPQRLLTTR
ncbi:MAG: hypothetical protein MZW92_12825 [Comamonadaceae bacterium]|nr:hypothetical protein [Comamonadaceae bacterium]